MMNKQLITAGVILAALALVGFAGCGSSGEKIESLTARGQKAMETGDFNRAIDLFRQALKEKPSDRDLLYLQGTAYKKLDLFDSALVYFKRGKILYNRDRQFNEELVELCPMYGDFSCALNAIAILISLGDNERMYWERMAELYYHNRELSMAVKYYKNLLDENPQRAGLYLKLSHTLSEMRKFDEAVEVLQQSLEELGPTPEAWANIGLNQLGMNNLDKAETAFRNSLSLKSDNIPVWINLANVLSSRDSRAKKREALEIYRRYQEEVPPAYRLDSIIPALETELGE